MVNEGRGRASEQEREHDEPREFGSDTAGRLRKHPPLCRLMDSADTAPLQSLRLLLRHAFSLPSHGFSHARSLPSSFPSLTLLLSLSPGSRRSVPRQACVKLQHHSQGGKNMAKQLNPVENERSKINKHILTWNYAN